MTSDLTIENFIGLLPSKISLTFVIDSVGIRSFIKKVAPPRSSFETSIVVQRQKDDRLILGFQEHEKVDGTFNAMIPLVVTVVMANNSISRILIDDINMFD